MTMQDLRHLKLNFCVHLLVLVLEGLEDLQTVDLFAAVSSVELCLKTFPQLLEGFKIFVFLFFEIHITNLFKFF